MDALVLESPGSIRLSKVPIPVPARGEILVRVEAATTCGTDLKAYLRGHPQIPMPGVFGHEYSGVVAEAGEGAPFSVGDPVMGVHSAPCQTCYWCVNGQENLCETIMLTKVLGSYAQYLLVPERIARVNVFPKPAELSFERASLLEPLSCVAQGLENLGAKSSDSVLIIGPGSIGLMFCATLRMLGFESVTLAGRNKRRLEVGDQIGVKTIYNGDLDGSDGRGYDVVIECTGSVEIWEQSLKYVRRGGKLMLFGGCPSGTVAGFDTRRLHYDQVSVISPFHFGTSAVRTARRWLLDSKLVLEPLLTGERELCQATAVFDDLAAGIGLKYVFRP